MIDLITETLTASASITSGAVASALIPLRGLGPAMIAAGHLESAPMVLVSGSLHVSICVVTGAAVSSVEENLNPVPGGASATADWTLYLPKPVSLSAPLASAVSQSSHLSVGAPPDDSAVVGSKASIVDLSALEGLRASS